MPRLYKIKTACYCHNGCNDTTTDHPQQEKVVKLILLAVVLKCQQYYWQKKLPQLWSINPFSSVVCVHMHTTAHVH